MDARSLGSLQSSIGLTSSSRSGSSKSATSGASSKGRDYTADNFMSPIDLEVHIQTQRLTAIIDEVIYKSKIVICLPRLIDEYNTLSSILSAEHMEDLLIIFEQYESPLYTSMSLLNMAALEDIKAGDLQLRNRLSPELSHLIYIMSKYPALKEKVEEIIEDMKGDCSKADAEVPVNMVYLGTLEQFRELMVEQMEMKAGEELEKKLHHRKVLHSNQQEKKKILEYLAIIDEEKASFEKVIKVKQTTIAKLEKELTLLNYDCKMKIKKKILDSERQMVLVSRAHAVKKELLREEEEENCELFNSLLRNHLTDEKQQRQRRFKVQTQLLSWLQKYDNEMADKQADLDEITKNYEEEAAKVVKLEAELAEQDIDYLPLMEEKEKEYDEEMTLKMNTFMREHAARVIQYAWRTVLANRAEKRRLKRLAKKAAKAEQNKK